MLYKNINNINIILIDILITINTFNLEVLIIVII